MILGNNEQQTLNDSLLAYIELKNDLLFHKIPTSKINYYINESLKRGFETAHLYKQKQLSIRQLCEQNNISVEIEEKSGHYYGVRFRAEFNLGKNDKSIKIYQDSIEELRQTWNSQCDVSMVLTTEDVINIHLAHEFFHYTEYESNAVVTDILEPIVSMKMGWLSRHAHVSHASEIAAHAFCKSYLDLPYLPNVYDVIYLIMQKKYSEDFLNQIKFEYNAI